MYTERSKRNRHPARPSARATIGYIVYNQWLYLIFKNWSKNIYIITHPPNNSYVYRMSIYAECVHKKILYTRYPIVARALGRVRARAKVSCIQKKIYLAYNPNPNTNYNHNLSLSSNQMHYAYIYMRNF